MNDMVYSSSALSARTALYMLNHARIQSLVRARNWGVAMKILDDCDYENTSGTIDAIIDAERKRTHQTFLQHFPDPAVCACVNALYNFGTTKIPTNKTLNHAEEELHEIFKDAVPKIKNPQIRAYFRCYLHSWGHGHRVHEHDLWKHAHEMRLDLDGGGYVFYWYVLKQNELIAVRIILGGLNLNLGRDAILSHLGGLYDRFK